MLPATQKYFNNFIDPSFDLSCYSIIIVQHLLEDTVSFIKLLKQKGLKIIKVIGIEYSSKLEIKNRLQQHEIAVEIPPLNQLSLCIEKALVEADPRLHKNILLHEVGGYFADILPKLPPSSCQHLIGIIEETTQGMWRYKSVKNLNLPVYHFSLSELKKIEAPFIGKSIYSTILKTILSENSNRLKFSIGILGYGSIGKGIAKAFSEKGYEIYFYDPNPTVQIQGILCDHHALTFNELIRKANLIIGASGSQSIDSNQLSELSDNCFLVSASSRNLEFPVGEIFGQGTIINKSNYLTTLEMPWKKRITILNNGLPANFVFSSLPIKIADLMFLQISLGIKKVISDNLSPGLHTPSNNDESKISRIWIDCYYDLKS